MLKLIQITLILNLAIIAGARAEEKVSLINLSEGIWFRCEFAHSQIPPSDNCEMLDDDGFQVIKGVVHHVKILDSPETACRHNRVGNCFKKSQAGLSAKRSEIGPIKNLPKGVSVAWLGCAQLYHLITHPHFIEITPDVERCWWTPDKRYFVARYLDKIKIIAEE
jgi:hypothetical protein